ILGGLAARGIGQEMDVLGNEIDQAFVLAGETDAPDRRRHHVGAAGGDRIEHQLAVWIAGGAEEEARAELAAGDDQGIGHSRYSLPTLFSHLAGRARSRRCRPGAAWSAPRQRVGPWRR